MCYNKIDRFDIFYLQTIQARTVPDESIDFDFEVEIENFFQQLNETEEAETNDPEAFLNCLRVSIQKNAIARSYY